MARRTVEGSEEVLGAIDVGTNAVRLELARVLPDGSLETLHTERDPVRPGEGLFKTGVIQKPVADRLMATLRRYAALCRRHHARVRAVATSAVREAKNREEIVRRARKEAALALEVVSGREEARLICKGVLHGKPAKSRSLCIDLGGGSTEIILAQGDTPSNLWSVDVGAVRLTELFDVADTVKKKRLGLLRDFARELMEESIPRGQRGLPANALGSSGTIGAIVGFARSEGMGHATTREISRAVERLADMDVEKRRKRFDPRRADIVVAGAVILEATLQHLAVETITPVDRGLREGLLLDLLDRRKARPDDHSLAEAAVAIGRRFGFGEAHGRQVAKLSLRLFDELTHVHRLPAATRQWLEVAALLHDVGHAVNYQRHHKHTHYLILNADIPGLTDRERTVVGAVARFHRRSRPEAGHEVLKDFSAGEVEVVRKLSTLLRIADSLDRSHHQPVQALRVQASRRAVKLKVRARHSIDLELWDVAREEELFREVFGRTLTVA